MKVKHCSCGTVMVKVGNAAKWWSCPKCGATAPLRKTPTVAPDSSLRLGPARRAWLVARYGGIQQGIKALIDQAMQE